MSKTKGNIYSHGISININNHTVTDIPVPTGIQCVDAVWETEGSQINLIFAGGHEEKYSGTVRHKVSVYFGNTVIEDEMDFNYYVKTLSSGRHQYHIFVKPE